MPPSNKWCHAYAASYADLPPKFARTRRSHGSIPAAYISMIGVDQRFTGRGHGGDLLVDALKRIARATDGKRCPDLTFSGMA